MSPKNKPPENVHREHKPSPPYASDPSMDLIFVIGDPEGQVDLLTKMFQKIQYNPSHMPFAKNDKIVVMGNFIHPCEPSGQDMIELLRTTSEDLEGQVVIMRGKNEHRLLTNREAFHVSKLGKNFINSYRVPSIKMGYASKAKRLHCGLLVDDTRWLAANTHKFFETNKYFVTPCGVDPSKATLDQQNINALMYISERFVNSQKKYEKMIVHGTCPSKKIDIKINRINVNTSAAETRVLSCAVLNDKDGRIEEIISVGG